MPNTTSTADNRKLIAILLAIFLAFWTWLYTYKADSKKFWIGLGVDVVAAIGGFLLLGIPWIINLAVWVWAIVDVVRKSDQWYRDYPNVPVEGLPWGAAPPPLP